MSKRKTKLIFRQVRDANLRYRMIDNGDRIAVGMSGGKDSLVLLYFLHLLRIHTPLMFDLVPIYIDLGWENQVESLRQFCRSLSLHLIIEPTNIGTVVFQAQQEQHPCSLCANLRRGALNRVAKQNGCHKVALGHHLDDAVHTLLMSIIYEGRYHVFSPTTWLDRMELTVIRPLIYVEERDIQLIASSLDFPMIKNRCPADGTTKRTEVKRFMDRCEQQIPGIRRKFLAAMENAEPHSFWR